jgi:DNA-binding NarL/FixJ family response regulator
LNVKGQAWGLGISKVVGDTSIRLSTPAELSEPLLAVLGEIHHLRADQIHSEMLAQDLEALENSVRRVLRHMNGVAEAPRRSFLSLRELNVLKNVAAGMSNKQIASRLGISEKTVRNHMNRIFTKLGARNRTEAVVSAMRAGLVST